MSRLLPRLALVALIFGTMSIAACKKNAPTPGDPPPMPSMRNQGPAVSEDEAKKFGEELSEAIAARDGVRSEGLFQTKDLMERCIADLNPPAEFLRGLRNSAGVDLSKEIIRSIGDGGSYKFLRIKAVDGRPRPLFRLLSAEGTVNYHEFILARFPDGRVGMEDVYVATTGEEFSRSMRRLLLPALRQMNRNAVEKLVGGEKEYVDQFPKIASIAAAVRAKSNCASALADYRSLPSGIKNQKALQVFALQLAMQVNEDEYLVELERFRANHATDPALDLVSIDYFLLKKQFQQAQDATDRLADWTGGDPYLNAMKAGLYIEAGEFSEADGQLTIALRDDPKLISGYWSRVTLACKMNAHAETTEWLKKIVIEFALELDPDAVKAEATYSEYCKSDEFEALKVWLKERK